MRLSTFQLENAELEPFGLRAVKWERGLIPDNEGSHILMIHFDNVLKQHHYSIPAVLCHIDMCLLFTQISQSRYIYPDIKINSRIRNSHFHSVCLNFDASLFIPPVRATRDQ